MSEGFAHTGTLSEVDCFAGLALSKTVVSRVTYPSLGENASHAQERWLGRSRLHAKGYQR